jgi:hypothetical protein
LEVLLTALLAGVLVIFDLDRTFYFPEDNPQRARLILWIIAFVLGNVVLAAVTYFIIRDISPFKDWNQAGVALIAGGAYLAIIHAKFTTFNLDGREVPFGFELFYQGSKDYTYKRINRIAKNARSVETRSLADATELDELLSRAQLDINQDRLLNEDEKLQRKEWLLRVAKDEETDEREKKLWVANYILSGDRAV